jgi:hypothetical protein
MWVEDADLFDVYLVHRKIVNRECDLAITKFLNDLYPDHPELTLHIVDFFEIAADRLGDDG